MSQDQMNPHHLANVLDNLIKNYGTEAVRDAAKTVLNMSTHPIPSEYVQIISAQKLADTVAQLDGCVSDLLEKGQAREAVYGEKAELMAKKTRIQTEIELAEVEALMKIVGEGKNAHVTLIEEQDVLTEEGIKRVPTSRDYFLTNDAARDAYRKSASSSLRKDLAEIEAQIAKIDVNLFRARDAWETAEKATGMVQSKAFVQGNLLRFLGGRGL